MLKMKCAYAHDVFALCANNDVALRANENIVVPWHNDIL